MKHRLLLLPLSLLITLPATAEKADRNKPMRIEANRMSLDDAKKVQILEGDVVITKGTILLKADRVVISEDAYGFQKGIAYSGKKGLAYFKQKREGRDDYIEGEGERIEYNSNTEIAEFFQRAWIRNGQDEIKGDYVWYDAVSEKYLATAGNNRDPKAPPQRVHATLQPKNKEGAETPVSKGPTLELRNAGALSPQPTSGNQ